MPAASSEHTKKKNKKDVFNAVLEFCGWLRIVAAPLLAGMAIGFVIYVNKPDDTGLIIAIVIACIGLIAGIIWATKISKRQSTLDYTTISSPDFDKLREEK